MAIIMENLIQLKSEAILKLKDVISKDLIVDYIIDHLVDNEVFTEDEKNSILSYPQDMDEDNDLSLRETILERRAQHFIDSLSEKMVTKDFAYNSFIFIILKEGYYPWIGHKILNLVSQMIKERTAINKLSAMSPQLEEESVVVCHDFPNKVKNLIQRNNKLEEIRTHLTEFGKRGKGWIIINGMGGSGKSILAAEAVRDWFCKHFKDGIWWTNCGQMTKDKKFDQSLLLLKMQLLWERVSGLDNIKFECLENAIIKLKAHFRKHPKSLIVLDDVWNREVLENFEVGIPILVTTRDKGIISFRVPDCDRHFIDALHDEYGLTPDESRQLLALWVKCEPQELTDESVTKIIEKFKGNPLCLTLIGSSIEDYGNDPEVWKSIYTSVTNTPNDPKSPGRRRHSSGGNNSFLYNTLEFNTLVHHSYDALTEELRDYYKYFALFIEDIRIPIEVFQTVWSLNKFDVKVIMDKLVQKSLVMTLKNNQITLYMVHDIILNFLKTQCKFELETLHNELLESYFKRCLQRDGSYKYSSLPNDGYIYYFLGYHIYKSNRSDLFSKIFLDMSFVVNKIRYTGPSDLLNDYYNYKESFKDNYERYKDFQTFVATNADLLCDLTIDVLQLALCQPNDSQVYQNALDLVSKSNRLYLKWCNQSNVKSSKLLSTKLHLGSVKYGVFNPKGNTIVSVGADKIIKLWDSNTGKQLRTLKGHQNTINCCQISQKGTELITASDDGTVKLWDISSNDINGNEFEFDVQSPRPRSGSEYPHIFNGCSTIDESFHTYRQHLDLSSGDTTVEVKCCAISKDNLIASGGTDNNLHIWKASTFETLYILGKHNFPVMSCHFSVDGKRVISSSGDEVIVWNYTNQTRLKTLKHEMNVENCVFGPKLDYIFTSSGRYVYQWSSQISRNQYNNRFNNLKTKYYVRHCAVSPNAQYVAGATTTDQIVIWSLISGYSRIPVATFKCADTINCINFNLESTKLLSTLEDGTVMIWDTSKTFGPSMVALRKKFAIQNHKFELKVLTPDESGTLRLFEGIEGKENKSITLKPKSSQMNGSVTYDITCCSLDLNYDILFGTTDGELIYHSYVGNETHSLSKHEKEVTFCAFIGRYSALPQFVSASKDSTFRNYSGQQGLSLTYKTPKRKVKSDTNAMPVLQEVEFGPIVDCKLFNDDKCMVWSENGSLFLLDLTRNLLLDSCQQSSQINSADIIQNEDSKLIATVSADNSVKLWRWKNIDSNTSSGLFELRSLPSHSCPRSCRFSPDASFLVIGYDSGAIKMWNFTESSVHKFNAQHTDWVNDLAVSPNGNLIISVSKSIKLWNRSGELLQTFKTNGGSMSSIYTSFVDTEHSLKPDSNCFNKIVTVDDAGILYILHILNFQ